MPVLRHSCTSAEALVAIKWFSICSHLIGLLQSCAQWEQRQVWRLWFMFPLKSSSGRSIIHKGRKVKSNSTFYGGANPVGQLPSHGRGRANVRKCFRLRPLRVWISETDRNTETRRKPKNRTKMFFGLFTDVSTQRSIRQKNYLKFCTTQSLNLRYFMMRYVAL